MSTYEGFRNHTGSTAAGTPFHRGKLPADVNVAEGSLGAMGDGANKGPDASQGAVVHNVMKWKHGGGGGSGGGSRYQPAPRQVAGAPRAGAQDRGDVNGANCGSEGVPPGSAANHSWTSRSAHAGSVARLAISARIVSAPAAP